jgi:hypothetical protein
MSADSPASLGFLILWGLIATVAMTSILEGSRGLGFSRMSLPFLVGTFFVGNRRRALILGFSLYTIGGWLFAFLYYFLFASVGIYSWWFGALAGFLHGIFLLVTALPLLPFVHPRMASETYLSCGKKGLQQCATPLAIRKIIETHGTSWLVPAISDGAQIERLGQLGAIAPTSQMLATPGGYTALSPPLSAPILLGFPIAPRARSGSSS